MVRTVRLSGQHLCWREPPSAPHGLLPPREEALGSAQSQQRPLGPALVLLQVLSKGKVNTN